MNAEYIALSIPVFFLLIALELVVNRRRGNLGYRFEDSITNLSCGIGQQVLGPFFKALVLGGYVFVYERWRWLAISETSILGWLGVLVGVDVGYYAFHRASHRVNFLWAAHIVHHQSEEYNLSVALRQSWFGKIFEWVFYLPLAWIGFPPSMFLSMTTLNTLYQFWIHTRAIDRLAPGIEWILNTPSHHRVHHGINPRYIDKNYAGIFILWDRLFRSFVPETEPVVYGIVKPLQSWNPWWANLHYWLYMAELSRSSLTRWEGIWSWFAPPEWRPASQGGVVTIPEITPEQQRKYRVRAPLPIEAWVAVNFALVGVGIAYYLGAADQMSVLALLATGAFFLLTLGVWGGLLERKSWAMPVEAARVLALALAFAWYRPF